MAGTAVSGVEIGLHTYLGFSTLGDMQCIKSKASCASIGINTSVNFGLYYDPFSFMLHADQDYGADACINFGDTLGKRCINTSISGYIDMGCCDPTKLAAGGKIDFPSPVPNVGIMIGIIPADFDIDIDW